MNDIFNDLRIKHGGLPKVSLDKVLSAYRKCEYDKINNVLIGLFIHEMPHGEAISVFLKHGYSFEKNLFDTSCYNHIAQKGDEYNINMFKPTTKYIDLCQKYGRNIEWNILIMIALRNKENLLSHINDVIRRGMTIEPVIAVAYGLSLEYCK